MKKLFPILISALLLISTLFTAGAALLSPGLDILSCSDPLIKSGRTNTPVSFSDLDFCRHAGISSYHRLTINSLPEENEGVLTLDGSKLESGTAISQKDTDSLVFTPARGAKEASFSFTLENGCTSICSLILTDETNLPPKAVSSPCSLSTFSNMTFGGHLAASDPEGDSLIFEITEEPLLGKVELNEKTGDYTYSSSSSGSDSFSFRAKDSFGNYSSEATVSISVSRNATGISFSDMSDSSSYAAAVAMTDAGVLCATEKNGTVYFEPEQAVSRLDFLMATMDAFGAANMPAVEKTDFADDGSIPESAKPYVYSAHRLGIINGRKNGDGQLIFDADSPITHAEAAVILNNVLGYGASADYCASLSVPTWAKNAVSAMHELGIFSAVDSNKPLTKASCASLLHNITSLV